MFLLPCDCSAEIEVVTGQAGGVVGCAACGRQVAVPKLRDFSALREKSNAGGPAVAGRWGVAHAVALAASAVALLAWGTAAVVGALPKSAFSPDVIRSDVSAMDDLMLYNSLDDLAKAGVARKPFREEYELQRKTWFAVGMSRVLKTMAGLAAVVAVGAVVTMLAAPKPS